MREVDKIAVLVPVYQVKEYLERCVESILNQTYSSFCLLLVDDGSDDGSERICDRYAANYANVFVLHKEHAGVSKARNAALDWVMASDCEWLCFVDSDDWVHPSYLERMMQGIRKFGVFLSICTMQRPDGERPTGVIREDTVCQCMEPEKLYLHAPLAATVPFCKIYHRECFQMIRYPGGKIHEDEFVTHRILFAQKRVAFLEEPLYYYFRNPKGIMNSSWNPARLEAFTAMEEEVAFFEQNGFALAARLLKKEYLSIAMIQYRDIGVSVYAGSSYQKTIYGKMKTALEQYRAELGLSPISNTALFRLVYPKNVRYFLIEKLKECKRHFKGKCKNE